MTVFFSIVKSKRKIAEDKTTFTIMRIVTTHMEAMKIPALFKLLIMPTLLRFRLSVLLSYVTTVN